MTRHQLYKWESQEALITWSSALVQFTSRVMEMERYCCDKKCFKINPTYDEVDGMACDKCEQFSHCMCKCSSFIIEPVEETTTTIRLYKTKHRYTCCPRKCVKFDMSALSAHHCRRCHDKKDFCDCILLYCNSRRNWDSLIRKPEQFFN